MAGQGGAKVGPVGRGEGGVAGGGFPVPAGVGGSGAGVLAQADPRAFGQTAKLGRRFAQARGQVLGQELGFGAVVDDQQAAAEAFGMGLGLFPGDAFGSDLDDFVGGVVVDATDLVVAVDAAVEIAAFGSLDPVDADLLGVGDAVAEQALVEGVAGVVVGDADALLGRVGRCLRYRCAGIGRGGRGGVFGAFGVVSPGWASAGGCVTAGGWAGPLSLSA